MRPMPTIENALFADMQWFSARAWAFKAVQEIAEAFGILSI